MELENQRPLSTLVGHAHSRRNVSQPKGPERVAEVEATWHYRLEALKVLTLALFNQIEALERAPGNSTAVKFSDQVHQFESELIRAALTQAGGRQRRAARLLGMDATTLYRKVKRYKIDQEFDVCN